MLREKMSVEMRDELARRREAAEGHEIGYVLCVKCGQTSWRYDGDRYSEKDHDEGMYYCDDVECLGEVLIEIPALKNRRRRHGNNGHT